MLAPAVERLGVAADPESPAYLQKLEFEAIKQTLSNLRSFPMIQVLEQRGYLHLHAAYFGVADGRPAGARRGYGGIPTGRGAARTPRPSRSRAFDASRRRRS